MKQLFILHFAACIMQDMVVEFARMNMHQLLEETEKAVSILDVSLSALPSL